MSILTYVNIEYREYLIKQEIIIRVYLTLKLEQFYIIQTMIKVSIEYINLNVCKTSLYGRYRVLNCT